MAGLTDTRQSGVGTEHVQAGVALSVKLSTVKHYGMRHHSRSSQVWQLGLAARGQQAK